MINNKNRNRNNNNKNENENVIRQQVACVHRAATQRSEQSAASKSNRMSFVSCVFLSFVFSITLFFLFFFLSACLSLVCFVIRLAFVFASWLKKLNFFAGISGQRARQGVEEAVEETSS